MIFAEQLKKLRKKSGLSQKEFAERVGVHMQSVSKWERGVMLPDISALDSIASALSVSVDELLGFPAPVAVASGFFDAQAFGKRLAQARRDKEKTQIEIESELGFSSGSLSRWESGQFCPDAEQLMLLCEALSVSPQALYFSPTPSPAAAKAEQTETERKNTGANNAGKIGSGKRKLWIFGAIAAAVIAVAGATAGITGAALAQRSSSANASSHHEWGVWEVISEPTCESAGVEVRYDENDPSAEPETRPIAALGHDWEQISVVPPTCTQNGFTLYECRNCHKTQSMDQTYFYGHDWKVVETVLPTCGEMGYTEYACDHCHTTEKRDYTATVGHDWKIVEKVEPTCETTGYTVFECEFCHVKEKRDYVSSVAHKYKEVSVVPPTCEEMGYTVCECEFCHVKEKRDYVPAVSHEFVAVETVAPTCEEMGYTVFECKYCHASEERAHVAALGHDWGYPFVFKEASCTEEGVSRRVCNRDASHHTDSVIAKKAHEYDDETGKCANCGDAAEYLLSEKSSLGKYKLLKWFESADVIDLSAIEHASELTEIAAGAFDGVTANKLIISDSIGRLDGEMFAGSQIKEIVLGKNVGSIVCRSRVNYPAITRITTNPDNPRYYTFGDGLVVYVNPNTGLGGLEFSPQDLTDVVIKDEWNVYRLLDGTFAPSEKLRTLVLPDTLKGVASTHDFTAANYPNLQRNIYEGVAYLPSSTNPYFAAVEIVDKTMATLSFHPDCKFNLIRSMEGCDFSTMHFLSGLKLSYEQFMTIPTPLTVYYEGTKEEWESLQGVSYAKTNAPDFYARFTVYYESA